MNYLSICSGIESATVAWHPLGWKCEGVSEIDPFRSAILNYHYPDVKNFGDFTEIKQDDFKIITAESNNFGILFCKQKPKSQTNQDR